MFDEDVVLRLTVAEARRTGDWSEMTKVMRKVLGERHRQAALHPLRQDKERECPNTRKS